MKKSNILIFLGIMIIVLSTVLLINIRAEDEKLLEENQKDLEYIMEKMTEEKTTEPEKLETKTSIEINNKKYIGILEIPSINLKLPVLEDCTKKNLDTGICMYYQSDKIIIGGHNSKSFFHKIYKLKKGDKAYYYDINSLKKEYKMVNSEKLKENELEEITDKKYSMILFTCTFNNRGRYLVEFE